MRTMKTLTYTRTKEVVDTMTCDLCGRIEHSTLWSPKDHDNVQEVSVKYKHGSAYGEEGDGVTTSFDVCPDCFENKLVPWFSSQNIVPTTTYWEY